MSGFTSPNHTQCPNDLFDLHMLDMGECELKVTLAIIRKTLGYHKKSDPISLSQLQKLTGLSRQGVSDGAAQAINRGIVEVVGTGKRGVLIYGLVINSDQSIELVSDPVDQSTFQTRTSQQSRHTKETTSKEIKEKKLRTPKKKSLTELEQWQIRLRSVEPIMPAILAKMERGFDPAFHTPETYLNLALMEKYVPLAEEVLFYKPTPQQWFAFYGEVSQEYNRNGWTVGIKTVREKFPGYMARMNTAAQKKAAPQPSNITHVDIELTPAEIEARKQQLAAVLKSEAVS